jgi:hypothetical protein
MRKFNYSVLSSMVLCMFLTAFNANACDKVNSHYNETFYFNNGCVAEFRPDGVYVDGGKAIHDFGEWSSAGNWRTIRHIRTFADVNGDGCADIVGFADYGVRVSLSNSKSWTSNSCPGTYLPATWGIKDAFGHNSSAGSWGENHPRYLLDMNGDRKDDIVGFGDAGVYVSLSTGSGFASPKFVFKGFGRDQGWGSWTTRYASPTAIVGCSGECWKTGDGSLFPYYKAATKYSGYLYIPTPHVY